jgi:serine/threonine protein kinase
MTQYIRVFDLNGDVSDVPVSLNETKYNGQSIFRKILSNEKHGDMVEYEIAKRLLHNPKANIVKVYDVVKTENECYIDMELLDLHKCRLYESMSDITKGISQLHTLNIVYIDVKIDNVGFSCRDGVYKLFDFDCSGIVDDANGKQWLLKPDDSFMYRQIAKHEQTITSLYKLDTIVIDKVSTKR